MGVSNYPAALDNFAAASPPNLGDNDATSRKHAARHDDLEAAMEAVQAELGTNPSGAAATVGAAIAGKADNGHSHSGYVAYPAGGSDDDVLTKSGSSAVWKAVSGGGGGGVDATAMHYKGDYMPNAYVVGDAVRYQGDFWVCVQNVSAGAGAPTAPYWERAVDVPDAYTKAESDTRYAAKVHTHAIADVTGLPAVVTEVNTLAVDMVQVQSDVAYRVKGYTSSNQPASPVAGDLWVDPDDSSIKVWNGSAFVNPSNAGGGGGAGMEWARITGGTVTEVTNGDGSVDEIHTFTGNGTLTVDTPGYARVLIVGAGGGGFPSLPGQGGDVVRGIFSLPSGAQAVTVGAFTAGDYRGEASAIGSLRSSVQRMAGGADTAIGAGGSGTSQATYVLGLSDNISGTPVTYSTAMTATATANTGNAGNNGVPGSSGIVIVRVQKSAPTVSGVVASGGTETTYEGDGTNGALGQRYRVHTFTGNGTLTVTQGGQADVLVCGAGAGGHSDSSGGPGGGAEAWAGITRLGVGTVTVTIAAAGPVANHGGATDFGGVVSAGGGLSWSVSSPAGRRAGGLYGSADGSLAAGGARGNASGTTPGAGLVSTISGASVEYGRGGAKSVTPTLPGQGGGTASAGQPGRVIVRYEIA